MKKLAIVVAVLFAFSVSAYAQIGGMMGEQNGAMKQNSMINKGMMPMTQMCMPMMQQMGQGMMMKDMMQTMMDMMKMQKNMMKDMKPAEKKKMMMKIDKMMERMGKMMSGQMGMMVGMPKVKCAEEWLKKAIDLHEVHIKDHKTATDASQMEMMDQMKKAYECITGIGSEIGSTQPKKPDSEEKKKDEHGH